MGTNLITDDSNVQKGMEAISKALIAAIPGVGGSISSLINDYQTGRKEKRLTEFLNELKDELDNLKDQVNEDYVSMDDFLDIFEYTAKIIVNSRQEEIRHLFMNILKNSIISKDTNYDETEELLRLMERLRVEHIMFLKIFLDPHKFNEEHGNKVISGNYITVTASHIMSKLLPNWRKEDIIDIVKDLENERLVKDFTQNYQTMISSDGLQNLTNKITEKGKRFCQFIFE
jgi:hypothetical protein